jgi:hypothetical protein
LLVFMVFFFDLCCSVSDSRPSPNRRRVLSKAGRGSGLQRAPRRPLAERERG